MYREVSDIFVVFKSPKEHQIMLNIDTMKVWY